LELSGEESLNKIYLRQDETLCIILIFKMNLFWENFLANFLSSVAAGIILLLLGGGAYKVYKKYLIKTDIKQENVIQKSEVSQNTVIKKQININLTEKKDEEIVKKLIK